MQASVVFPDAATPTLVVIGTGGTIAGLSAGRGDAVGYDAAQVGVAQLMSRVPVPQGFSIVQEQLAQVDSKDMDHDLWRSLAQRCSAWLARPEVQGVVVTHGTDTLEETAFFLQSVLAPHKPLVLACSMRPADALSADGPANLRDALAVAAWPGASGVTAVCAGAVHAAQDVRKVHPYRLDAFDAGDAGPLGYLEEGQVRLVRPWPQPAPLADLALLPMENAAWPWVEIVSSHAGADGAVVDALARAGVQGLVVVATGNGSVHWRLQEALLRVQAAGVRVLRTTRCARGSIVGGANDALAHAGSLTPAKARIALLLSLLREGAAGVAPAPVRA